MKFSIKKAIYTFCPNSLHPFFQRIEKSNFGYRIVTGVFWTTVGSVISRGLFLLSTIVVARILGKVSYGQFAILQSTVMMFAVFAGFGLGQTAIKYVAEFREKDPLRAGRILALANAMAIFTGIICALVLYILAPWLASKTLADSGLTPYLRIGSLILIMEAMNGAQVGALFGFESFKKLARISIWVGLFGMATMIAATYFWGLAGAVWALAADRAFRWLLNHIALRSESLKSGITLVLRGAMQELPILWKFSLPAMLGGIMVIPATWICNAMLVNQPDGYGQMGILQATLSFQQAILFIGATLGAPVLPILANMVGSGQNSEKFSHSNVIATWFVGALPVIFLIGFPEIGQGFFGKDYAGRDFLYTYIFVLLSANVMIFRQGLSRILLAHGVMWLNMFSNIIWAITMIGCLWFLIHRGAAGYSIAWAITHAFNCLLIAYICVRKGFLSKKSVLSAETVLIWLAMIFTMFLSLLKAPLLWRSISTTVLLIGVCSLFWRLFKYRSVCSEPAVTLLEEIQN